MQRIVEKWVYAAAIIPNSKNPNTILKARGIPRSEWGWIKGLRGHNIHNAAAGVVDYRTGEILAYAGSASYTAKGSKKLQPQFDVLSDGWRQPGSSIKPLVYLDRDRRQDDDGGDDVHGRRDELRASRRQALVPDAGRQPRARSGPAAQRTPVLAQHPGDQGRASSTASTTSSAARRTSACATRRAPAPVASESIGTLEVHPIDLISAYGAIAERRRPHAAPHDPQDPRRRREPRSGRRRTRR